MGKLFGGGQKAPPPVAAPAPIVIPPAPTITAPAPMPEPDSTSVNQAKRRAAEVISNRAGRASTILTGTPSSGGGTGDTYGSKTLG